MSQLNHWTGYKMCGTFLGALTVEWSLLQVASVWYVSVSCVVRFWQHCVGYTRHCQLAQWRYSCNLFLKHYIRVLCLCQLISDKILLSEYDESVKYLNFMSWWNLNRVSSERLDHRTLEKTVMFILTSIQLCKYFSEYLCHHPFTLWYCTDQCNERSDFLDQLFDSEL